MPRRGSTNARADSPPGINYDAYVQAVFSNDPNHSTAYDWVYGGYRSWEPTAGGHWEMLSDASGYAPNGAEGLEMSVGDLAWPSVAASVPVGWCRSYESEDAGGGCTDYVDMGTAVVDLSWTPTSRPSSWTARAALGGRLPPGCTPAPDEPLSRGDADG